MATDNNIDALIFMNNKRNVIGRQHCRDLRLAVPYGTARQFAASCRSNRARLDFCGGAVRYRMAPSAV
jgi:hypothetical protein